MSLPALASTSSPTASTTEASSALEKSTRPLASATKRPCMKTPGLGPAPSPPPPGEEGESSRSSQGAPGALPVASSSGTEASRSQARTAAATRGSRVCWGQRSVPSTSEATRRMASASAGPEAAESGTARREEEEERSRGLTTEAAANRGSRGGEVIFLLRSMGELAGRCQRPLVGRVEH